MDAKWLVGLVGLGLFGIWYWKHSAVPAKRTKPMPRLPMPVTIDPNKEGNLPVTMLPGKLNGQLTCSVGYVLTKDGICFRDGYSCTFPDKSSSCAKGVTRTKVHNDGKGKLIDACCYNTGKAAKPAQATAECTGDVKNVFGMLKTLMPTDAAKFTLFKNGSIAKCGTGGGWILPTQFKSCCTNPGKAAGIVEGTDSICCNDGWLNGFSRGMAGMSNMARHLAAVEAGHRNCTKGHIC